MGGPTATSEPQPGSLELVLPRPATAQEAIQLAIHVGTLPSRARLRIATSDGALLGTVSPFGVRRGQAASYNIPVPKAAIVDGRLRLRLEVEEPGAAPRPPVPGEVESVTLLYVPVTN